MDSLQNYARTIVIAVTTLALIVGVLLTVRFATTRAPGSSQVNPQANEPPAACVRTFSISGCVRMFTIGGQATPTPTGPAAVATATPTTPPGSGTNPPGTGGNPPPGNQLANPPLPTATSVPPPTQTPVPPPANTPIPTATSIPTRTPTPPIQLQAQGIATPTATRTPTVTKTPTPTRAPTPVASGSASTKPTLPEAGILGPTLFLVIGGILLATLAVVLVL